jgi:hypothetical protein
LDIFSKNQLCVNFEKKVWVTFWMIIQKIIWSPCAAYIGAHDEGGGVGESARDQLVKIMTIFGHRRAADVWKRSRREIF